MSLLPYHSRNILLLVFIIGFSGCLFSNNLVISNVSVVNNSTITFNLSWDNSWRTSVAPTNHDAVWLFVKKKDCITNLWSHVDLNLTPSTHSVSAPLEIYIDGKDNSTITKGVFIRRSTDGSGNISGISVSLQMAGIPSGDFDFKVFGIEMVQIPQGSFYLGDGNTNNGTHSSFSSGNVATPNTPYQVTSEAVITAGTSAGQLYYDYTAGTAANFTPLSLPATYPKGYNEVYCMKYEISQGQYADFMNTLTSTQIGPRQSNTNPTPSLVYRLNITGTWPTFVASTPHRAMNWISWDDLLSYLDWSALRPMTELEFEKFARGPLSPIAGEYAWGTANGTDANTLVNDGTTTEGVTETGTATSGLVNYGNTVVNGPIRCGFTATGSTTRVSSGAGYYGVMELSGNVSEMVITTVRAVAVAFDGTLGDGEISSAGVFDASTWPNNNGGGMRGGDWYDPWQHMRLSAREKIDDLFTVFTGGGSNTKNPQLGGRGVR